MTDTPSTSQIGRHCLPTDSRRRERVVVMVTTEEHARLLNLSARQEQSISTTCRDLILKGLQRADTK